MWANECDISFYRLKEALSYSFYSEYVKRLRESVETVHNFARVHQQEGSLGMKRRYDMCSVTTTLYLLYGFTIPNKMEVSCRNLADHMLLRNGLMMLCTGSSEVTRQSLKWCTETAF